MPFAQVVIGPPGSGKTTYCNGMYQFLNGIERKTTVVNLDPANDSLPYPGDISIMELISLEDAMNNLQLGPNGGIIYCMEYLADNMDWLEEKLKACGDDYIVFDCPGQVELYTHNDAMKRITDRLAKIGYRVVFADLNIAADKYPQIVEEPLDSHYCTDAAKYISVLLLSLKTMLQLELPHVNVLSKVDLIESYGRLPMALDFYTNVADLGYLQHHLNQDPFMARFQALNAALCDLVEDFGLVGFETLCIQDKESVTRVVKAIDKAGGYVFGGLEEANESIFMTAVRSESEWESQGIHDVQERYMEDGPDSHEDLERFAREFKDDKNKTPGDDVKDADDMESVPMATRKRVGFAE
ncbi:GPN-loop GTPase 2 [Lunasporangiospora selenospora]|uniref:GPN-loop GTPase 2 n=1 Tax=Lunasporangiospora selenospora TaxID=979761 RepID=A0A9P6KHP5_9FUNG|nr:GPN-loop GTPase 2 [Lunasporangiospora selenospora]